MTKVCHASPNFRFIERHRNFIDRIFLETVLAIEISSFFTIELHFFSTIILYCISVLNGSLCHVMRFPWYNQDWILLVSLFYGSVRCSRSQWFYTDFILLILPNIIVVNEAYQISAIFCQKFSPMFQ